MTVSVNATATAAASTASDTTLTNSNLTVAGGATALLAVLIFNEAFTIVDTVSSISWDAAGASPQPMTLLAEIQSADVNVHIRLFGLVNPTPGNRELTANWVNAAPGFLDAIAFNGSLNSSVASAFLHAATNSGITGVPTISITSAPGNLVVAAMGEINPVTSLSATSSTAGHIFTDPLDFGFTWSRAPGAGTVAWTGTPDSSEWAIAGIDIMASDAATTSGSVTEAGSATATQAATKITAAGVTEAATATATQTVGTIPTAGVVEAATAIANSNATVFGATIPPAAITPTGEIVAPKEVFVARLPIFGRDHGEIAWGHWLAQFMGKGNLESFVRSLFEPVNTLDTTLRDLMRDRWLDTAAGVQLDGIGSIVGQKRVISHAIYLAFFGFDSQPSGRAFGVAPMRRANQPFAGAVTLDDANYRTLLRLKIALNNGHGTTEEVIAACMLIFRAERVIVQNNGNASMTVSVGRVLDLSSILYADAQGFIPRAAGVGITLIQFNPAHPFGFISQGYFGFGEGRLASVFATP